MVMAAVRAIEHFNTWTAPTGGHRWYGFIDEYLTDGYTLRVFAQQVVFDVFAATQQYLPDRTPGTAPPRELEAIQQDIVLDGGWGTRIDSPKTISHVATLRGIYANHWLARRLAESDDILSSPAAISTAFDDERRASTRKSSGSPDPETPPSMEAHSQRRHVEPSQTAPRHLHRTR
jgi:hypothetical protein